MSVGFSDFTPEEINWQNNFYCEFFNEFDWNEIHEIMLSGAVGSAKTTAASWLAIHECITQRNIIGLIARKTLPDLKKTLFMNIWEMLEASFRPGIDFQVNETQATIYFPRQNSWLLPGYWRDKRYKKFRSLELTFAIIEELTENNLEDKQAYDEILMRIGRRKALRHFMLTLTNPDAPTSWQYKYFIEGGKKVYYSITEDNPYLDKRYVEKLKKDLDPKLADRMLRGLWVDINNERVYYSYNQEKQFFKTKSYEPLKEHPIIISFDFNIGDGKPMSSCMMQKIGDTFHVFNQSVIHGARTLDMLDDYHARGLLKPDFRYLVCGDASGKARDTRSLLSDYELIQKYLSNLNIRYDMNVPLANPPIKTRHNIVNSYCLNDKGEVRIFIYKDAPTVDEGLRLTRLKAGGKYIEDDGPQCPYQHITTALGYAVVYHSQNSNIKPGSSQRRF
jgi:hypothetical protein